MDSFWTVNKQILKNLCHETFFQLILTSFKKATLKSQKPIIISHNQNKNPYKVVQSIISTK